MWENGTGYSLETVNGLVTTVRPGGSCTSTWEEGGEPRSGEESETGGVMDGGGELAVVTVKSPATPTHLNSTLKLYRLPYTDP